MFWEGGGGEKSGQERRAINNQFHGFLDGKRARICFRNSFSSIHFCYILATPAHSPPTSLFLV